ncbi:amidase [Acidisphaera sp. L21]|uniref:amidase n=1 Tax=Acidisphaera sp. L21 TaxID=1641851 RepID=UPI00131E0904|nr:amidase [Acidisphaera sp. L21]
MPDDQQVPTALHELTIAQASAQIARGALSPVELVRALIARAEALNPELDAYLLLTAEKALAQAQEAETAIRAGNRRGPMHGIPFGLKDIFFTKGIRTTGHSRVCADFVPDRDATTVTKLYESGAVLMGKLATHEFAHGGPSYDLPWPPARNPWKLGHITGGSSSGSGAAIAAGLVPAALGTDTGGSIRSPAAFCGIVGLKPTYGLVSRTGVYPNSFTFDNAGPMTWTVEDCAFLLQAIAGYDKEDPGSAQADIPDYRAALTRDIRGLRIGFIRHFHEEDIETTPSVAAALEEAAEVLRSLGAVVETVRLRPATVYGDVKITIAESELFSIHEATLRTRPGDFGLDFQGRVLGALMISGSDYVAAQRERRAILAEMQPVYRKYDALITAGAGGPAPAHGSWRTINFWKKASFTTPFNVAGMPTIAQCMGFADGLPLSLQVAGRPFEETTVLRIAHAYEKATDWRANRPAFEATTIAPPLPQEPVPPIATVDAATRARVALVCKRAGLTLSEPAFESLCAAAPLVEAMTRRLRRERDFDLEPANVMRMVQA